MIIGLSGQKGVGKDSAANFLAKKYNFEVRHFADKLKRVCAKHFGLDEHLLLHDVEYKNLPLKIEITRPKLLRVMKDYGLLSKFYLAPEGTRIVNSPRELMQYIGTDVLRKIDNEIHIKSLLNDLVGKNAVIADVRFVNEALSVKKMGGLVLSIVRGGVSTSDLHPSEMESVNVMQLADFVVENNGSLDEFFQKIENIFNQYEKIENKEVS